MKKLILAGLLFTCFTMSLHANSWSGTSRTIGNTTYHNFNSGGVTVLPPANNYRDNGNAVAGAIVLGALVGVLICECVKCFKNKPKHYPQWYYNYATNQYEYK